MTTLPAIQRGSIILVAGTNEQYTMPLAVTLSSLLINLDSPLPVEVYILSTHLSAEAKRRLTRAVVRRSNVNLTFITVDSDLLTSYSQVKHLTVDALLRLFSPKVLPPEIEKALYLDCDLLVLKDVTPLWQLDETGIPAQAAFDPAVRVVSSEWGLGNYRELGLPANSPYFNSGVMLMNLTMWRAENIGPICLDYVSEHETHFLDQDAINAVLAGRIGVLPMTWNALVNHLRYFSRWPDDDLKRAIAPEIRDLQRSPAICHFAGAFKPWLPGYQIPFVGRWIYYLWRSRWFSLGEAALWTAKWSLAHIRIVFGRKVLARLFKARSAG